MNIFIKKIRYSIMPADGVVYENCPPIISTFKDYTFELKDEILTCTFSKQFQSKEIAMEAVEMKLKSWQIFDSLKNGGRTQFTYKYLDCDKVDMDAMPGSATVFAEAALSSAIALSCSVTGIVIRRSYPEIPITFEIDFDSETLFFRYEQYICGHDLLPSMAYFCLSYLEFLAGGKTSRNQRIGRRDKAANKYQIDKSVLNQLGNLTAERGDRRIARKVDDNTFVPLTSNEINWIEKCVLLIIKRLGEYRYSSSSLKQITLQDLPQL